MAKTALAIAASRAKAWLAEEEAPVRGIPWPGTRGPPLNRRSWYLSHNRPHATALTMLTESGPVSTISSPRRYDTPVGPPAINAQPAR